MTVQELRDLLDEAIRQEPSVADLPVHMYSDAEGNQIHRLHQVGIDAAGMDSPPLAVLMIPDDANLGGW